MDAVSPGRTQQAQGVALLAASALAEAGKREFVQEGGRDLPPLGEGGPGKIRLLLRRQCANSGGLELRRKPLGGRLADPKATIRSALTCISGCH